MLLKRLFVALLAFVYLCLSIGIPIHVHYCMDSVAAVSIVPSGNTHFCAHCGMEQTLSANDCCREEHKLFKNSEDQLISQVQLLHYDEHISLPAVPVVVPAYHAIALASGNYQTPLLIPPENSATCPVFLRFCNLRI